MFEAPAKIVDAAAPFQEFGERPVPVAGEDGGDDGMEEVESLRPDVVERARDFQEEKGRGGEVPADDLAANAIHRRTLPFVGLDLAGGIDGVP